MTDLAHSLATRKGQAVARDPMADSFEELMEWEKREVLAKFAAAHNWAHRAMRYVPAEQFGWVAQKLIRGDISEEKIRAFVPEVGPDPDAPLSEIESPVACAIEDSRERSMIAVAEERDDVEYDEDAGPNTPYHERFRVVEEESTQAPLYQPPNTSSSHHSSETEMLPSSQKARDYGEWTDPHAVGVNS
jgi:hypothetical protein